MAKTKIFRLGERTAIASAMMIALGTSTSTQGANIEVAALTEAALAAALTTAEGDAADDVITFAASLGSGTINLSSALNTTTATGNYGTLTINGDNRIRLVNTNAGTAGIFSINQRTDFNLQNIELSTNSTTSYGNLITTQSTTDNISLTNVDINNDGNSTYVRAIQAYGGGSLTISSSTITGMNSRFINAGVVATYSLDTITVSNSTFSNNSASQYGGVIHFRGSFDGSNKTLNVQNSVFSNNTADVGGAIMINNFGDNFDIDITNTQFTNNTADESGAAFTMRSSGASTYTLDLNIDGVTFSNNTSTAFGSNRGGAVDISMNGFDGAKVTISNSTFSNNGIDSNNGSGGAVNIYARNNDNDNTFTISNVVFENNVAANNGGALRFDASENGTNNIFNVINSTFTNNETSNGDGAGFAAEVEYSGSGSEVNVISSTFSGNTANSDGGGFMIEETGEDSESSISSNVINSTFINNSARYDQAGGIFAYSYYGTIDITIANTTITNNVAETGGGVNFYSDSGQINFNIVNSVIANNFYANEGVTTSVANNISLTGATPGNVSNNLLGTEITEQEIIDAGATTVADNIFNDDPGLGALADNGGLTQTLLPNDDSPVIDAGSSAFLTVGSFSLTSDQRGFARETGSNVDIGAVETDSIFNFGSGGAGDVTDDPLATAATDIAWLMGMGLLLPVFRRRRSA